MDEMKFIKMARKKSPEELQEYLMFQRRGTKVKGKKGRGTYSRKTKHKNRFENS